MNLKPGILTPTPPGPEVTATQPGVSCQREIESLMFFCFNWNENLRKEELLLLVIKCMIINPAFLVCETLS